jgi:hypothetical protein
MIFVVKNNYIFVADFCMWFFMPKYTSAELITII